MEISYSILSACLNGAIGTHIMFRCYLNSRQLHVYLDSLLAKELIDKRRDPPSVKTEYFTTVKGRKYIEVYDTLASMLDERQPMEKESFT
jgi:predicted transcriptional regulator